MTPEQAVLTLAALLLVMTMCVHSLMGQRRLVQPLLDESTGVMTHASVLIVPFAWHLTSGIGLVIAAILLAWAWEPDQARTIGLAMTGLVFTVSGLVDAIGSKGKHIGWAPLTLIGLSSFAALLLG
jgi:hypothetical protein